MNIPVFIQSENGPPTSLDPLLADYKNNIRVMRMLYASILEISREGILQSQILENFGYDEKNREIRFTVKKNKKYSDGTQIESEDIAFSIVRMADSRPKFPVIRSIHGLSEWLDTKNRLATKPKGIKVLGDAIVIQLTEDVRNPLFRFALEVFSVIPRRSIDIRTNSVLDVPPFSGLYSLRGDLNADLTFFFRKDDNSEVGAPNQIKFEYLSPAELIKAANSFSEDTVALASEATFNPQDLKELKKKFEMFKVPTLFFRGYLFSDKWAAFKERKCRQYFAKELRKTASDWSLGILPMEASIFSKMVPGYKSLESLEKAYSLTHDDERECLNALKAAGSKWCIAEKDRDDVSTTILIATLRRLEISQDINWKKWDNEKLDNEFLAGRLPVYPGSSGFWDLDPAGDLQMFFTPKMHKNLDIVSSDKYFQDLVLDYGKSGSDQNTVGQQIAQYLFDDGKLNIYTHTSRFFLTRKGNKLKHLTPSLTMPSPWQVFRLG